MNFNLLFVVSLGIWGANSLCLPDKAADVVNCTMHFEKNAGAKTEGLATCVDFEQWFECMEQKGCDGTELNTAFTYKGNASATVYDICTSSTILYGCSVIECEVHDDDHDHGSTGDHDHGSTGDHDHGSTGEHDHGSSSEGEHGHDHEHEHVDGNCNCTCDHEEHEEHEDEHDHDGHDHGDHDGHDHGRRLVSEDDHDHGSSSSTGGHCNCTQVCLDDDGHDHPTVDPHAGHNHDHGTPSEPSTESSGSEAVVSLGLMAFLWFFAVTQK